MNRHELYSIGPLNRKCSPTLNSTRYSVGDNAGQIGQGNVTMINYMTKARSEKLRLIDGDSEVFSDILSMIDEYEGVLLRHESLAANLGAKLVAPLLLNSFQKLFENPIKIIQNTFAFPETPVTWLEVVMFARTNPSDFQLTAEDSTSARKVCRIWVRGGQIEISEDDYRLIMSGGPERMIPTQPIADDESAELSTLTILEARLAVLIKRADAVASKARQLNYQLKGRRNAVLGCKAVVDPLAIGASPQIVPTISNHISTQVPPIVNGEIPQTQAMLLKNYLPPTRLQASSQRQKLKAFTDEAKNRMEMASRIEKLNKGDPIWPPCDRCRRLKFDCFKHLTACQACTKRHAKCAWKDAVVDEFESVPVPCPPQITQNGYDTITGETSSSSSPNTSEDLIVSAKKEKARETKN